MRDRRPTPAPAELERIAVATARAASRLVGDAAAEPLAVGVKSSETDVVTETDLRAEACVRRLLADATPHASVLGEEEGGRSAVEGLQWVVDPLDGTVNFLYGIPLFAVSIAAVVDGDVVAGAVADVHGGEVFSASSGAGARCDGRPIAASSCSLLSRALVATGFSYHADMRADQAAVTARVLPRVRDVRCFGSAALELCWVACGRIDGYFQRETEIWDRAAGAHIAEEAGASVELPCPENDDVVLATAAGIYEELRAVVSAVSA